MFCLPSSFAECISSSLLLLLSVPAISNDAGGGSRGEPCAGGCGSSKPPAVIVWSRGGDDALPDRGPAVGAMGAGKVSVGGGGRAELPPDGPNGVSSGDSPGRSGSWVVSSRNSSTRLTSAAERFEWSTGLASIPL